MSTQLLAPALYIDLPPQQKLALIAIADNATPDGEATINHERLAARLYAGATRQEAVELVEQLESAGYLTRAPELDDLFDRESFGFMVTIPERGTEA